MIGKNNWILVGDAIKDEQETKTSILLVFESVFISSIGLDQCSLLIISMRIDLTDSSHLFEIDPEILQTNAGAFICLSTSNPAG
jgi:hypothetical protein